MTSATVITTLVTLIALGRAQEENPTVSLVRAAAALGAEPLFSDQDGVQTRFSIDTPFREDLAISRLQDKTRQVIQTLWESILDQQRFAIIAERGAIAEVLRTFADSLQADIFAVDNQIQNSRVESLLRQLEVSESRDEQNSWKDAFNNLEMITGKMNLIYSYLDGYLTNQADASQIVLEDYSRMILQSQDGSIHDSLVNLHELVVPQNPLNGKPQTSNKGLLGGAKGLERNDLFFKLYKALRNPQSEALCHLDGSPQQLLQGLYNLVALTEVKGYTMLQFSYLILTLAGRGNYSSEAAALTKTFNLQNKEKLIEAKDILSRVPREYWMCDPSQQIEGTTYVALKKLLQGHIENEVDMNSLRSCKDSCSSYKVAESQSCFKNLFCAKQEPCTGRLFDCSFYNADAWVCMSTDPDRKYDWIEYENGILLGAKDTCINKIKVDSWWRWLFWHCSYCLCKCDAPGPRSDRFWSLRPAVSDVSNNMIVTGVRFVKKSRVIHIEIEQARALPEGAIDESTRDWSLAEPMMINDDISAGNSSSVRKDVDFMMMSYEQRAIDTDRLEAPVGHVITGLKFRSLGGHLNLEIQVTPISFSTGKLLPERSTWVGNDNTPATIIRRTQVEILSPDVPTRFKGQSMIDTGHNQFILFDTTSPNKDVMQTTIPFIDSQNVTPNPGTWISGVGLYHKGAIGYGGYMGLMVKTFDVSRHLVDTNSTSTRKARKYFS